MGWATPEDVAAVTGKTVDDAAVQRATYVVEMTSGGRVASLPDTILTTRNLYWLRLAVSYQAAFMVDQPDFFTRVDVTTYSQDGVSAQLRSDGLVLAPNARRALNRLSWRGVRTVRPSGNTVGYVRPILTSDDYDDSLPWRAS